MKKFDASEVDKVAVKLTDGSLWEARYDTASGKLVLLSNISPPPAPSPPKPPTPPSAKAWSPTMVISSSSYDEEELEEMDEEAQNRADEIEAKPVMEDSVFRAKLSNIMTDNMFDRRVRGRTRGRLDMRRLWKAETLATNVFEQKQARKNKAYNIVLLVDESGSMQEYGKIGQAAEVAAFLAKTFDGLNLNLAIVGFNAYMALHKDFEEKLPDLRKLKGTMVYTANHPMMGIEHNNDFEALSYAYKMFEGRKGQNFLIMLSDGQPATAGSVRRVLEHKTPRQYLEEAIKNQEPWAVSPIDPMGKQSKLYVNTDSPLDVDERDEKKHLNNLVNSHKDVVSIGIGLCTNCWQIPNHIREDNMNRLKPVLLKEIEKQIKRG